MKTLDEIIHDTAVKLTPKDKVQDTEKYEGILRKVMIDDMSPKDAMEMSPESLEILYSYAYQLYNSGNYQKSLLLFSLLSFIDSTSVKYRMGIAASFHRSKDYKKAIDAYLAVVPLEPFNPMPLFHAADCWIQLKQPFEAACCLQVAMGQAKKNEKYSHMADHTEMILSKLITNFVEKK